jgi:hypothetical protein
MRGFATANEALENAVCELKLLLAIQDMSKAKLRNILSREGCPEVLRTMVMDELVKRENVGA